MRTTVALLLSLLLALTPALQPTVCSSAPAEASCCSSGQSRDCCCGESCDHSGWTECGCTEPHTRLLKAEKADEVLGTPDLAVPCHGTDVRAESADPAPAAHRELRPPSLRPLLV